MSTKSSNPVRDKFNAVRERAGRAVEPAWQSAMDTVRPLRQRQIRRTRAMADRLPFTVAVPYLFLTPFFVLFSVFLLFPILYTVYLSFHTYEGIGTATLFWIDIGPIQYRLTRIAQLEFVGLQNYQRLLGDALFQNALANTTFILLVQVPLMIVLGLALALALNASWLRFKGLFRTTIALPVAANLVAYATVFLLLLQDNGLVNTVFQMVGLPAVPWLTGGTGLLPGPLKSVLGTGFWPRISLVGAVTWRWTGYNMIILLAGLQSVPKQLYEAAEIDGANRWEKFRYVTLPQLRPVLLFVVVTSTIGTFRLFSEPLIISEGGAPLSATRTLVMYIYNMAFQQFQLGYASAMTVVLVGIVAVLSIVQLRVGGESDG
ncbi:sugar ABC transporter permease [Haloarcula sp. S1CR25-12]|uniref:Sugar ABC transporter permease n=1 Tax=Haloarcula saliterrae TaxID=2950534 RepID=A0ABU2FDH3_9EURY|nr:sugar ABC transporter permease [Haloarcula sp. S1CR25-12]MDS0260289.1 sugar ABC transporter permease [Haloarcula sp. S1CR25-12]